MENRNFKLDTEWNMIHYSEKPNGFGILILGDDNHFVDEQTSSWIQNERKQCLLENLKKCGYTCFYSNLYGKHWGAKKAIWMAERLYHHIMRTEIINSKIHIIAEGMGALVALKLLKTLEAEIRSIILINPVFSLKFQLDQEREHKFYYKKLLKEISQSYECEIVEVEEQIKLMETDETELINVPLKMVYILSGRRSYHQYEFSKNKIAKWEKQNKEIQSSLLLPEKTKQLGVVVAEFFHQFEIEL